MSYQALYRKFRPDTFSGVKGQEHITTTLKNQIKAKRIGHAYLFCGTRGTGKTTVAKILAKAVNCDEPVDGDPCGICQSCLSIASGSNTDVVEMDAASNNGIDDMRSIIDSVSYTPAMSRLRVYIVDEAHMLSNAAANAFLKTLEEPPAHVIFILATTDPQRLPITIRSRCQRYDFRRMTVETIKDHMELLLNEEGVKSEDEALLFVAKAADGSMRDALSLLDQCIAFQQGDVLTYENVLKVLGAVDRGVFGKMLSAVEDMDVTTCISILNDIVFQGRELTQFVLDFTEYLRDELLERIKEGESGGDLMDHIRELSALTDRMKFSTVKRILADTTFIKLCRPQMAEAGAPEAMQPLLRRISFLEKKVEELESRPVTVIAGAEAAGIIENAAEGNSAAGNFAAGISSPGDFSNGGPGMGSPGYLAANAQKPMERAVPEELLPLKGRWREIIGRFSVPDSNYISACTLSVDDEGALLLVFPDREKLELFGNGSDREERFRKVVEEMLGKTFTLKLISGDEGDGAAGNSFPNLFDTIDMNVEIED